MKRIGQKKVQILLIEDDNAESLLFKEYLSHAPHFAYKSYLARNLEQSRNILSDGEKEIDIVILDLGLKDITGIETFNEFSRMKFEVPVIIVTGIADEQVGLEAIENGAQDYLVKGSLNSDIVVRSIKYSLARFRAEEKLKESNRELRRLKNSLEREVAETVQMMLEKDSNLIAASQQVFTGEMISHIASQWKQPLNALSMIIQTIRDAYDYDELDEEILERKTNLGVEMINYLAKTIDNFRDYFHPGKQSELFEISRAIEQTISFIQYGLSDDGIRVHLNLDEQCTAIGYPNEFSQALINIINNAQEIMKIRNIELERRVIEINLFAEGDRSVITVTDHAGGIASEQIGKIFEPYYTTKEKKGTGVGLFIASNLIKKNHNGVITAANTKDGAEFRITI